MVSEAKCSIFFSPNVDVEVKAEICTELNITSEALSDKYLGLPSMVGLDRSDSFVHLLERIIKRLENWNEKFLSLGGKEILLEAVIQAIPVFAMSVFQISKKLCKEMTDAMSIFWWGTQRISDTCIGWHGGVCASQKIMVEWVLEIFTLLILQC